MAYTLKIRKESNSSRITGIIINGAQHFFENGASEIRYVFTQDVLITGLQVNNGGWASGSTYYWRYLNESTHNTIYSSTGELITFENSDKTVYVGIEDGGVGVNYTVSVAFGNGMSDRGTISAINTGAVAYSYTYLTNESPMNLVAYAAQGYRFAGWYTNANGTGTPFSTNPFATPSTNLTRTYYARFEPIGQTTTYRLTVLSNNTNQGTVSGGGDYPAGMQVDIYAYPNTEQGYYFSYWIVGNIGDDNARINRSNPVTVTISNSNPKYTAYFAPRAFTVTYNANGNNVSNLPPARYGVSTSTFTLDSRVPTRPGYTFIGWSRYYNATSAQYQPGDTYTANENITLYAVWHVIQYQIRYYANNGTGADRTGYKQHGEPYQILGVGAWTYIGHTFSKWISSPGNENFYEGDYYETNAELTLYAQWITNRYTVSFNLGNHGAAPVANQTVLHGMYATEPPEPQSTDGYTFKGWYINQACTEEFNFQTETITSDTVIYVGWEMVATTVTIAKSSRILSAILTLTRGGNVTTHTITTNYAFSGNDITAIQIDSLFDTSGNSILGRSDLWNASAKIGSAQQPFGEDIEISSGTTATINLDAQLKPFEWAETPAKDGKISDAITAVKWNLMRDIIAILPKIAGAPDADTVVNSGDVITATIFNNRVTQLAWLQNHGTLPATVFSGTSVMATSFGTANQTDNSLKSAINAAIDAYNQ